MQVRKFGKILALAVIVGVLTGCSKSVADTTKNIDGESTSKVENTTLANIDESGSETTAEATTEEITTVEITTQEPTTVDPNIYDFTLCFAGDVSLEENAVTTKLLDKSEGGLKDCISPELLKIMNDADYCCVNNEFTYSTRGTPMAGKTWTFRANPSRVKYLQEMGVDLVLLANNHVYDYGKDAMIDTMDTLDNAGIKYFGAGRNLTEAMKPVYVKAGNKTIAYVAASRAEKHKMTPQATDDSPGILRCYDPALFLEVIKEARENADFVIANVHWGTERSTVLEDAQLTTGKQYIDAGADVVIGSHSHCLQGIEYYKGKPIVYSLGNYWFDEFTERTMLANLHFYGDSNSDKVVLSIVPAMHKDAKTTIASTAAEKEEILSYLEKISVNVKIDEYGVVTEE